MLFLFITNCMFKVPTCRFDLATPLYEKAYAVQLQVGNEKYTCIKVQSKLLLAF